MAKVQIQIDKLLKDVKDLKDHYNIHTLDSSEIRKMDEIRDRCENSYYEFVKEAWAAVEGVEIPFYDNWHIKALADHMQAMYDMTVMNLIVNLPPRCSKSTIISIMYVPWVWIKSPHLTFLYVSHSYSLAEDFSRKTRDLLTSPWYQKLWGDKVKLRTDANSLSKFYNTAGGFRMIASMSGGITGQGAWFRIFDDANDKESIFSPLSRTRTNLQFDGGFSTRIMHPKFTRTAICSQRLHESDLTGYVLSKDNANQWVHLCLPMEYDPKRPCSTIPLKKGDTLPWMDPRQEPKELLWPSYWGRKQVEEKKGDLRTAYNIASQFQQQPASDEGNVIKREWFKIWKGWKLPECHYVIQSWDTAISDGENSAYSACTTWGIFEDPETDANGIVLLNCWRGKVKYYELRRIAKRLATNYYDHNFDIEPTGAECPPDLIIIEAKATGSPLIDDLSRAGILAVPFDPVKEGTFVKKPNTKYNSKGMRAEMASALIEAGRVWLPAKPPYFDKLRSYADEFMEAACMFPAGDGADYVDSMSQCFIRIMKSNLTHMPDDPEPLIPKLTFWDEKERLY